MVSIRDTSLAELARDLVSHPNDEAALTAVCAALRDGGQVDELIGILDACSEQGESLPNDAPMVELTFRIAKGATGAHARELCRAALDRCPAHLAALSLFEQLADASWSDELCARYQMFLEDAPLHAVAPDICEVVACKLVEAERDATARHEVLDDVHHLARVYECLYSVPAAALSGGVSEVDRGAERQSTAVLSMHA